MVALIIPMPPQTTSADAMERHVAEEQTQARVRKTRTRRQRDLTKAVELTALELTQLYGMSKRYWHDMAAHSDPSKRLPSKKIPGRSGRKGSRLFNRADVEAWLAQWEVAA